MFTHLQTSTRHTYFLHNNSFTNNNPVTSAPSTLHYLHISIISSFQIIAYMNNEISKFLEMAAEINLSLTESARGRLPDSDTWPLLLQVPEPIRDITTDLVPESLVQGILSQGVMVPGVLLEILDRIQRDPARPGPDIIFPASSPVPRTG